MNEKPNPNVTAVDELLRATISAVSLVLCQSTGKTVVVWPKKDIGKPFGVSTCKIKEVERESWNKKKRDVRKQLAQNGCALQMD